MGIRHHIRIRFNKQGDVRFISHHDLMRLFERAVRRAGLPVAVTSGFNPRLKIWLPLPLPVGTAGENEIADFELHKWLRPMEFAERLARELPSGLGVKSAVETPRGPDRSPREHSYRVQLLDGHPVTPEAVEQLMAGSHVTVQRQRKGVAKAVDIRPFIEAVRLRGGGVLDMLMRFTPEGTGRPEEVLQALGCQPGEHYLRSGFRRTSVSLSSSL